MVQHSSQAPVVHQPVIESLECRRLFTTYTISDLNLDSGTSFGVNDTSNTGIDVNAKGAVAGTGGALGNPDLGNATLLLPAVGAPGFQAPVRVDTLGSSFAKGVNDKGDVVGQSDDSNFVPHAFVSLLGAGNTFTTTSIGALPKLKGSIAYAINNKRQVVGSSGTLEAGQTAFVWQKNAAGKGVLTALPKLSTHTFGGLAPTSTAVAINDAGVIVGRSSDSNLYNRAVMWKKVGTKWSAVNINPPAGVYGSNAYSINAKGFITGDYIGKDFKTHAFVRGPFTPGKITFREIKPLAGNATLLPNAINSKNQIVGIVETAGGDPTAVLCTVAGSKVTVTNLNSLLPAGSGWVLDEAMSINAKGQIVGLGKHNSREEFGFILSPVA